MASDRPPLGRLSGRARAKVDAHATERADGSAGQRRVSREGQARPAAAGSAVGRDSAARRTRATVEGLSGRGGSPPTVTGSYVSLMVQKRALTPGALTSQERQPATLASSTRGQEPGDMSASSAGTPALSSGQSRPAVGKGKSKSDPEFRRNSVQERRNRAETIREGASYLVEDTGPIGWDFAFNPFSKISRASDPGIGTGRKVADNSRWPVSAHLRQLSLKRGGGSARA